MSNFQAIRRKELYLKKLLEDVYALLKDNDAITLKFKEKGKNVQKYRDIIRKSKDIADKINSNFKNKKLNEAMMKKSLLELEEVKSWNEKLKNKFMNKINSIEVKKGEKTITVNMEVKKKNSIFPDEKEIKQISEGVEEVVMQKKKSMQVRMSKLLSDE